MTPIVGVLSDQITTKWGKRKPWYVFGVFFVVPTFLGIFAYPAFVNYGKVRDDIRNAWYIILPALFNIGWAAVQISHMSIVNQLSGSNRMRDKLVNNRNGFTYAANITVLAFAVLMFKTVDEKTDQFRYMSFLCVGLGFMASSFFMLTINEVQLSAEAKRLDTVYQQSISAGSLTMNSAAPLADDSSKDISLDKTPAAIIDEGEEDRTWKDWLKEGVFYIFGMVYMMVRIAINVTMTMQPFYLTKSTGFLATEEDPTPVELALVPLISYILSLIFSLFLQQRLTRFLRNRFLPMLVAIVIIVATSVPLAFLNESTQSYVYPLVGFQGIGLAIMLNTATSMISDVVGKDAENSAFVYGCYSLFDKFANGGLLFFLIDSYESDGEALKIIMSVTPIVCAVVSFILTYLGAKFYSNKLAKITGVRTN